MPRKPNARDAILDAAEAVVARSGAAHLTLDAVASQAGLSKGGLLYHFPAKEALLQGMVERMLARVEADKVRLASEFRGGEMPGLLAHIRAGFLERPEQRKIAAAMLAAGANDPRLLEPVRAWNARNFASLARARRNPSRAAVIMLAIDGLWLNELLQISPLSTADRRKLQVDLESLSSQVD